MNPFPEAQSKNVEEERSGATLFDRWASHYDRSVRSSPKTFPFAGYEQVLDEIVSRTAVSPSIRILDLGTGTGNLAKRFIELGCDVGDIGILETADGHGNRIHVADMAQELVS